MRERILFELSCKKRRRAVSRFVHNAADILNEKYTCLKSSKEELLFEISYNDGKAHVISDIYDGIKMDAQDAIEYAFEENDVTIVIFNDRTAFVKMEVEQGISDKYLLKAVH